MRLKILFSLLLLVFFLLLIVVFLYLQQSREAILDFSNHFMKICSDKFYFLNYQNIQICNEKLADSNFNDAKIAIKKNAHVSSHLITSILEMIWKNLPISYFLQMHKEINYIDTIQPAYIFNNNN